MAARRGHAALLMEAKEAFAYLDRNRDGKLAVPVRSRDPPPPRGGGLRHARRRLRLNPVPLPPPLVPPFSRASRRVKRRP